MNKGIVSVDLDNIHLRLFLKSLLHSQPAIIGKTPAEFKILFHKSFWGGVAGDCLELIDQPRLTRVFIKTTPYIYIYCHHNDCDLKDELDVAKY